MTAERLVDRPSAEVHNKDTVGHAFGVAAEITDEHGQRAAADAVEELAGKRDGTGGVVG